ncbi:MAG: cyclopropane-fatty-acyl-phospholipid synthase family protein [Pseudomonadales bacterium]|jgi:cyclopropane-fatty-acyl-phospholipid synthase|nr:cyclopropane-fatty-acyl-phospholipid synthase family protein [Pseudomonadales bacterium]
MAENIAGEIRNGWLSRIPSGMVPAIRRRLLKALDGISWGVIEVHEPSGTLRLGHEGNPGPRVSVRIRDMDFYAYAGLGGSVGAGQSYFLGLWDADPLVDLVRIMVRNRDTLDRMDGGLALVGQPLYAWFDRRRRNSLPGSRANISAHYDLGNDFFSVMLDPSMMYSAGIYPHGGASLEDAQQHKLDVICDKLCLDATTHLLEIGTGWGGLAIHAARRHGCRVTTTTISREQHALARARVQEAGLEDRITVLFSDYRELEGRYDRLVSIEMIEAVGHQYFDTFFARIDALLEEDGMALIQGITIEDQRYEVYRRSVDFIKRFVFPGGSLPSVSVMMDAVRRVTSLRVRHLEDIGQHYARTLDAWRQRIEERADELLAAGYDAAFLRLWRFYLAYCEGGFRERSIGDVQLLLEKPECRLPSPVTGVRAGFQP